MDAKEIQPMGPDHKEASDYKSLEADHEVVKEDPTRIRVYKRRWLVLFLFSAYSFSNNFQWIHLNIISNVVHKHYNESIPGSTHHQQKIAIDWLSMVYMLMYIPLIFPATWLLEAKGLRVTGIVGSLINALGAWIKCGAVSPTSFPLLLVAQTVCATAQVFILGIPPQLAGVWFGPDEVSTATAIGVVGNMLGAAVGFLIPPEIVPNVDNVALVSRRLGYMFYSTAAGTTVLFILICIFFHDAPPTPPSKAEMKLTKNQTDYFHSLKLLFTNTNYMLLVLSFGIISGTFYAIGTELNVIILTFFESRERDAGQIGLTMVVCGILACVPVGVWLDHTKAFKGTSLWLYAMTFIAMLAFTLTLDVGRLWVVYLCSGLLGVFLTGYIPVGFEFAAEITFPEPEGTSAGFLNASAQIFGILLTFTMTGMIEHYNVFVANSLVCALLLLGTIVTGIIKSDFRRQAAGRENGNGNGNGHK